MLQGGAGGGGGLVPSGRVVYDGKRMRKAITRRTIDHCASIMQFIEDDAAGRPCLRKFPHTALQPNPAHIINVCALSPLHHLVPTATGI